MTFGVNHLGPFLLTDLLLPLVLKAGENSQSNIKPKIINVSSVGHKAYPLDYDKLEFGPDSDVEAW